MTNIRFVDSYENDVKWYDISGSDTETGWYFDDGGEIFGITTDDIILDCDGCSLTIGDRQELAVRNALAAHATELAHYVAEIKKL